MFGTMNFFFVDLCSTGVPEQLGCHCGNFEQFV